MALTPILRRLSAALFRQNGTAHSTAQDMRPLMASFTYRSVDSVAMLFSGLGSSPPTPAFSRGAMMDVGSVVAGVCRWHNK